MMSQSVAIETARGMQEKGELDCGINAMFVRLMGVRIVSSRVPADVRRELNDAVKAGKLGHLKKKRLKPEVYFHPGAEFAAREKRNEIANAAIRSLQGVFAAGAP